ncbi:hypothetical protein AAS21_gp190 [Pantoea phage vB_PagS_AAS21]|uniref:Uncharacterized protein n=1 Tax=Pantoea phage vB_PagS_AAS21 TaxID=2575261 RepID=A0A4Y5P1T5_9CAUD|nr:hypothetical protein AAS21_gp190 [Pantoea phage vB_PagS_AAS21]
MKGQLICDYKVDRWVTRQWVTRFIQVRMVKRFYGRLRRTEGTFVDVDLD